MKRDGLSFVKLEDEEDFILFQVQILLSRTRSSMEQTRSCRPIFLNCIFYGPKMKVL